MKYICFKPPGSQDEGGFPHPPSMPASKSESLRNVHGQPSWRLANADTELFVTRLGGHLAPVTFDRRGQAIRPFAVAPWAKEKLDPATPNILRALRGDFFCLPFGGNDEPYRGERHPPHGETANSPWTFVERTRQAGTQTLHLRLDTRIRRGRVDKFLSLRAGEPVVYSRHVISGMSGPISLGHHATLRFPAQPGSGIISTSPFRLGQVFVEPVERPEARGYSSLVPGATFASLDQVPSLLEKGGTADLSRYPARRGYEDIVLLAGDPALAFAWTAVCFPRERHLWFALKNPRVLRHTLMWISNGGRHYPPWNGRHVDTLGLEEITSWFHGGLAPSVRPNALSEAGHPTSVRLDPRRPLGVNYIMGAVPIPRGFDRVRSVEAVEGGVTLSSDSGKAVRVPLDLSFLEGAANVGK